MTSTPTSRPLSVVVAGGGTAGHIEPALAVAEAVRRQRPDARITALGTPKGLESTLVPARGVDLELIPPVPIPRSLSRDLFTVPSRLRRAVAATTQILEKVEADVLIGFGGYVSAPAYLAARRRGIPFFIHEANARAGMANKLGIRLGGRGLASVPNSGIPAEVVGTPVKESVLTLDRAALRAEARAFFGVDPDAPLLLVTGGSQGAASINAAVSAAADRLTDAGIGILHAYGRKNTLEVPEHLRPGHRRPPYVAVDYIDRMDLALSAADAVLCRSGAMTVAENSAVGLPALYVPLPHGNGEQALNAQPIVASGGGYFIEDADLSGDVVVDKVTALLGDEQALAAAARAAAEAGHRDSADRIAERLIAAAGR